MLMSLRYKRHVNTTAGLNKIEVRIANISDLVNKNRLWCKAYLTFLNNWNLSLLKSFIHTI